MKILVLDDDKNICDILKMFFEDLGHTVMIFQENDQAKAYIDTNLIDLAIVDYFLDDKDETGIDIIKYIKNLHDTPCILITGKVSTDDIPKEYDILLDKGIMLTRLSAAIYSFDYLPKS